TPRHEGARRAHRRAYVLRRVVRTPARRIGRRRPVGRRLGQSGARRCGDDALRHARADDLSHEDRTARRRARVSGVRHALPDLPGFSSRGDPELRPRHAGNRLPRGEARGWRTDGADGARACGLRHSRDGPPQPDFSVGTRTGWLPGAGTRRTDRRAPEARRQGAAGCRCLFDRAGTRARAARLPDHEVAHDSDHRHRCGTRLRRPGTGAAGHAGVERPVHRQIREALRGHRGGRAGGGDAVYGRGTRGPVSRSRAFVSEVNDWTRRDVLAMLAAAAWTPLVPRRSPNVTATGSPAGPTGFRVRTITAGTNLKSLADTRAVDAALATLKRAKRAVTDAGYEVQTVRIATQPLLEDAGARARAAALAALQALDRAVVAESALLSIGRVLAPDGDDPDFAAW